MVRTVTLIGGLLSLAVAVGGCAKTIVVDGIDVRSSDWDHTLEVLIPRVSYEFECPREQLTFTLIRSTNRFANEVGAEGCGRRQLFTRVREQWFGSDQSSARAAAEQQAAQERQRQGTQMNGQPR